MRPLLIHPPQVRYTNTTRCALLPGGHGVAHGDPRTLRAIGCAGLDITVALGLDRRVPEDRLRVLLDGVDARTLRFFRADLAGFALRATDLDWSFGSGTPLLAPAQDLLLLAYGRKIPLPGAPGR